MTGSLSSPLQLERLGHDLGGRVVLRDLSLSLGAGEIVGLAGLNGQGKTTLLRLCTGLDRPGRGRIAIFGRDPREVQARRSLAYLPESHRLPPSMTGRAWINAQCRVWKIRVDRGRVEGVCRSLDLDPTLLDRSIGRCSKGTERKVALAGVLIVGAPLTLLDEPADGLDPRARAGLKACLREARDGGRTVLFSSHVLAEVEDLCDRLLVLNGGRLAFDGSPARLREEEGLSSLEGAVLARVG